MFGIDSPLRSPIRSRIARKLGSASAVPEEVPGFENVKNRKSLRSDPATTAEPRISGGSVDRASGVEKLVRGWLQMGRGSHQEALTVICRVDQNRVAALQGVLQK